MTRIQILLLITLIKKIWAKVMNEIIKTKQEQTTDFKKPADIVKSKSLQRVWKTCY